MRLRDPIAVGAIAVCLLAMMPAQAANFLLAGGETIEGTIVEATRNTLVIRRADGGMRQIPIGRLLRIRVRTADGGTLTGPFQGWQDGRTAIEVGTNVVWIEQDQVVEPAPLARPVVATDGAAGPPAAASPSRPAAPELAAARAASEPAGPEPAAGPQPAPEQTGSRPSGTRAEVRQALPPAVESRAAPEQARAEPAAAPLPAGDLPVLSVKTAPDDVTDRTGEIVFTVELSRPIDDLLVLIYSTVDGTAHAGTDYAALQGILTLPAGTTRSEIRTAILDHGKTGGDKDFNLFLAANPGLTKIAQQWTRVTIHDAH